MTSNKITEEDLKKFLPNSQAVKRQAKNDDLNFDDSNFSKKKKGDKKSSDLIGIKPKIANISQEKKKPKKNKQAGQLSSNLTKFSRLPELTGNSVENGKSYFEWLINPVPSKTFMNKYWEKKQLLIKRDTASFKNFIFTTSDFNNIMSSGKMQYTVNCDVTSYKNGVRKTENPHGVVLPRVAWKKFQEGCSLRIKNPQSFSPSVLKICSTMQDYFKSMVGANIYLTPPGTQGFAPHYDDIEAFVLQLEGKKHWKVYQPVVNLTDPDNKIDERLPRMSSHNFTQEEIGDPVLEVTLYAGDLLYFPRGFVHQANALPDVHSLHITISTYQCNSWYDLMKTVMEGALENAMQNDVEFRKGIPLNFFDYNGVQNSDQDESKRQAFKDKMREMVGRLAGHVNVDEAADSRYLAHLHDFLPPVLTSDEKKRTVRGVPVSIENNGLPSKIDDLMKANTKVKLLRKNCLRVVNMLESDEEDEAVVYIYHNVQNPTVYHSEEEKLIKLKLEYAPVIEYLLDQYPNYSDVEHFPLEEGFDSIDNKISIANQLFNTGLIMTEKPLKKK